VKSESEILTEVSTNNQTLPLRIAEREASEASNSYIEDDVNLSSYSESEQIIRLLHQDDSYYVCFVRKSLCLRFDKRGRRLNFENLAAFQVSELHAQWEYLRKYLSHDSYFTVNSYHRAAPYLSKVTGLPSVWRKEEKVQNLNACYCDLDIGRSDAVNPLARISAEEALIEIESLILKGVLPQPNIITKSGRGLYLFWLLQDANGNPVHANFYTKDLYKQINRAINILLKHLAADVKARDCARVLRVPFSINSKTGKAVTYEVRSERRYTLRELAERLKVPLKPIDTRWTTIRPPNTSKGTRSTRGLVGLYKKRCSDIIALENHLGGFKKGSRRQSLTLYARCLRECGTKRAAALILCKQMAGRCKPLFGESPEDEHIEEILTDAYSQKRYKFKNITLMELLQITPTLARELNLQTIVPDEVKQERQKPKLKQVREQFIRDFLSKYCDVSAGEVSRRCSSNGIQISTRQASRIMNRLGYNNRPAGRRPSSHSNNNPRAATERMQPFPEPVPSLTPHGLN
jgi:hypothetical protein